MTLPLYVDSCQFHLLVNTTQCHILLVAQLSNLSVTCVLKVSLTFLCALVRNSMGFVPNSTANPRKGMEELMWGGRFCRGVKSSK